MPSNPARAASGAAATPAAARRAVRALVDPATPRWSRQSWARTIASTVLIGACVVSVVPAGASAHASAVGGLARPDPAIELARQRRPDRTAERAPIPARQLAELRERRLQQTAEQIDERRQQSALQLRRRQLARDRDDITAEAERLRNLSEFSWPTAGGVSSGFGYRIHPILRTKRLHNGADIGGACGQPIWAAQAGTVIKTAPAGYNGGSGHNVRIDHGDIDGVSIQTAYLHMDKIEVKVGQLVAKGERIGTVGSTGLSTACHLHLTLYKNGRASDPLEYIRK